MSLAIEKADEVVRRAKLGRRKRGPLRVELLAVERFPHGVQAFFRAWQNDQPLGFGLDGTAGVERLRIVNPAMLVPYSKGTFVRRPEEGRPVRFKEDPAAALFADLIRTAAISGRVGPDIDPKKVARTTTIVRPNAGTGSAPFDGQALRSGVDEDFATILAGSGTASNDTVTTFQCGLVGSSTTDQYQILRRGMAGFDTSAIGSDTIASALLQLYGNSTASGLGADEVGIVLASPASESAVANGDYSNLSGTDFATRIATASITTSDFNDFDLNASGIAAINTSGNTFFGIRLGWDIDASFGGTWADTGQTKFEFWSADQTGTTQDPVLTIVHSGGTILPMMNAILL